MGQKSYRAGWLVSVAAAVLVAGCTAQYRNHGYVPDAEILNQITVGVDTRETVDDVVGAPSTAGLLRGDTYYYIRTRMRHYAYRRPEPVDREVLAISFSPSGVVSNIETFGLEQGRVISLERRVTSSNTADRTFIRQLLGNLGQIDAGSILGTE